MHVEQRVDHAIAIAVPHRFEPGAGRQDPLRDVKADLAPLVDYPGRVVFVRLVDVQRYLPASVYVASYGQFEDQQEIDLYDRMLHETEFTRQRTLMRDFEKHVLDNQAHEIFLLWYYRIVPYRSYVKGWKISPSHYLNQDLATVWLDK